MDYECGKLIKDGGEGKVYEVLGNKNLVIKIYKNNIVTTELQHKLEYMKKNPPVSLIKKNCLAWPVDIIYSQGKLTGFVMPRLVSDASLLEIYTYKHPSIDKDYNKYPSVQSRIGIAINLTYIVSELHKAGYVIGDMNHENIGINRTNAQVQIFDCDSFTITESSGKTLRTNVCMEGYLAPEIIKHCNSERAMGNPHNLDTVALPTFTKQTDLFCLAVHIFRSLMNGLNPFLGVNNNAVGSNAAPFIGNEGVERNNYIFKQGLHTKAAICLKKNEIPREIKNLFDRAFLDGDTNPNSRPTTEEWYVSLTNYLRTIKQCTQNTNHQFYNKLSYCPYCKADERYYAVQSGSSQPKPSLYNQQTIKPIVSDPSNRIHNITQHVGNNSSKNHTSNPQHSVVSFTLKKTHKLRNILIGIAAVIICFFIWQKGKSKPAETTQETKTTVQQTIEPQKSAQQKTRITTLQPEPGETFTVPKYVHIDLNVHEEKDLGSKTLFTVSKDSIVYLSNKHKDGVIVKIKFDDNHIGWLNSTYLRDFKITSVQVGNNDNYGIWLTEPGHVLYASQIKHFGICFYADKIGNNNKVTFFIKIRKLDGSSQIWNKNISTKEHIFADKWTGEIKTGKNEIKTFFNMRSNFYIDNPGVWIIEMWYHDPKNNNEQNFTCIASTEFTLF